MFKEESCGDKRLRLFGPKRAITPPNCFTELLMEGKVEASLTKLSQGRGLFWRTWEVLKKRSTITLKKNCIPLKEFQGLEFMAFIEVLFLLARLERLFEVEEVRSAVDQCSAKKNHQVLMETFVALALSTHNRFELKDLNPIHEF